MSQVTDPVMLNTTGQDIVAKLQGVIDAINGGTIDPLTVTQNGVYIPPSGVIGYAPVTVNVSGGGGGGEIAKDTTFLPNSAAASVVCSSDITNYSIQLIEGTSSDYAAPFDYGAGLYVDLSGANTDATCYCAGKRVGTRSGEAFILGVPYALSTGNDPLFDIYDASGSIMYSTFVGNTTVSGKNGTVDHLYAIAVNGQTKRARFFIDGEYLGEKAFSMSGSYVAFARGMKNSYNYDGDFRLRYVGVVSEFESDNAIIANMQTIMRKLEMA